MSFLSRFGITLLLAFSAGAYAADFQGREVYELPRHQVEQQLPASHPANYYAYATRLFQQNEKNDAVFWFYVGELRYRFHLTVNPKLAPDTDPALFGSLHESVGSVINLWAGADPDNWAKQMGRALEWDAENENGFTSKSAYAAEWRKTRGGLEQLKEWVLTSKREILEERKKNGTP